MQWYVLHLSPFCRATQFVGLYAYDARKVLEDVIQVEVPDGICFRITKATDIMEGHDYPGIRFMLDATLDKLRQTIKIDISTGGCYHTWGG